MKSSLWQKVYQSTNQCFQAFNTMKSHMWNFLRTLKNTWILFLNCKKSKNLDWLNLKEMTKLLDIGLDFMMDILWNCFCVTITDYPVHVISVTMLNQMHWLLLVPSLPHATGLSHLLHSNERISIWAYTSILNSNLQIIYLKIVNGNGLIKNFFTKWS